jgi:hypothetical protein
LQGALRPQLSGRKDSKPRPPNEAAQTQAQAKQQPFSAAPELDAASVIQETRPAQRRRRQPRRSREQSEGQATGAPRAQPRSTWRQPFPSRVEREEDHPAAAKPAAKSGMVFARRTGRGPRSSNLPSKHQYSKVFNQPVILITAPKRAAILGRASGQKESETQMAMAVSPQAAYESICIDERHRRGVHFWSPQDFSDSACRTRRERLGFVRDLF